MLRDIISSIATCNIFWAADFLNWKTAVDQLYPTEIDNISNLAIFQGFRKDNRKNIFESWNIKYLLKIE
jgi:hypothetical protein